ncbi:hypothetical protein PFICI_15137 [Pestalotiopsis fici W106-1]|uniref:chitinase n=1 Tax=Pestalotiopsis fici (strain W106-1 / CGMCC3.15140) TaxID=1229662 RepID=W3WJ68_PESFW|nr:uncharacterized protein PFICI_15137 [Pestalotiopsis fici W106-1]ETS73192.1 hypothetical protein PFICI_15137 [Pestalotiopsis fici W106-1]
MQNSSCYPNPGLNQYEYFIDFTNPPADLNEDWSTSNYATITYNTKAKNGAEFTFAKRYDAPQLFTNFYIFFGRVDVVMQVSPGVAMISSAVLMSDDFDEIDWEMSGNDFNLAKQYPNGVVQNNYFSKGITGNYDRGQWQVCTRPQTQFHTYSFDWTPERLQWLIDGQVIRTFLAANADNKDHQYPQTPSKFQMGIWSGGDPDQNDGTRNWAGGYTDLKAVPYTMFVKSVRIKNYNPAKHYKWTDQSGSWKSIKLINDTVSSSSSTSPRSSTMSTSSVSSLASPATTAAKSTSTTSSATQVTSLVTSKASTMSSASGSRTTTSPASTSTMKLSVASMTGSSSTSTLSMSTRLPTSTTSSISTSSRMTIFDATTLSTSTRISSAQTTTIAPSILLNPAIPVTQSLPSSTVDTTSISSTGQTFPSPTKDEESNPFAVYIPPSMSISSTGSNPTLLPSRLMTSAATPSRTMTTGALWPFKPSRNGLCAYRAFKVCKDSGFGDCCSRWGYCGSTEAYCADNCLRHWGSCWKPVDEKKTNKRSDYHLDRRDRAYPPGKRPNATDIV